GERGNCFLAGIVEGITTPARGRPTPRRTGAARKSVAASSFGAARRRNGGGGPPPAWVLLERCSGHLAPGAPGGRLSARPSPPRRGGAASAGREFDIARAIPLKNRTAGRHPTGVRTSPHVLMEPTAWPGALSYRSCWLLRSSHWGPRIARRTSSWRRPRQRSPVRWGSTPRSIAGRR